jgi:hypothetical protein
MLKLKGDFVFFINFLIIIIIKLIIKVIIVKPFKILINLTSYKIL